MKMKDPKMFAIALAALFFIILTFTHNWLWIIPAAILTGYNWKRLYGK